MAKQALGKGLGALIKKSVAPPTIEVLAAPDDFKRVPDVALDMIVPSPLQPRTQFVESPLDDLMESIRQHGIIQPLIVRAVNGKLELIAGERRWRASGKLGLDRPDHRARGLRPRRAGNGPHREPPARGSQPDGRSRRLRPPRRGIPTQTGRDRRPRRQVPRQRRQRHAPARPSPRHPDVNRPGPPHRRPCQSHPRHQGPRHPAPRRRPDHPPPAHRPRH